VFCLVYGFSNAATHGWGTPSTYGFVAAGVALGVVFAAWQGRAATRCCRTGWCSTANRGGAYLSMFIGTAGLFGTFLFLTYYLRQTLGYWPLVTGFAFLPMSGGLIVMAICPRSRSCPDSAPSRWSEPAHARLSMVDRSAVLRSRESPGSGDASSPAWRQAW
jgi:hypothetical protein